MLGSAIVNLLSKSSLYELYYVSHSNSISNGSASYVTIDEIRNLEFHAFFHCAAEVNVNICQLDLSHALKSNRDYTRSLFQSVNADFSFYISTDSVYEGKEGDYKEYDSPKPLNNYSLSKLMGEQVAQEYSNKLYIIRTNIVGNNSKGKSSLIEWGIKELQDGKIIYGYSNVFFNPLSVQHLSLVMLGMLENPIPFGIYNIGTDTYQTKYDFLLNVASSFGLNQNLICRSEYKVTSEMALRPLNTTINCNKIKCQMINLDLTFQTSLNLLIESGYEKS